MECFGMPVFKDYTREELKQIKIEAPEEQMRKKVQKNWDHVAKPLDGMGRFEALTAQIGAGAGFGKHPSVIPADLFAGADL